jgi:hypothetical protein
MNKIQLRPIKKVLFENDSNLNEESSIFLEQGFLKTAAIACSRPQIMGPCLTGLFLLWGFYNREALLAGLSGAALLMANYFYLKAIAEGLHFKFDHVRGVNEKETAQLRYSISNHSSFNAEHLQLNFEFMGSVQNQYKIEVLQQVPFEGLYRGVAELSCDIGMGIYKVNKAQILVRDLFNIFEFAVHFDDEVEVEVRPKIEPIPPLKTKGSKYSEMYGLHEIESRGLSVNFSNLRPYSLGDSIRHIAWRPSARHDFLVVKEFERMVNTDAVIVLNLNPFQQVGVSEQNTWEVAKDLCLSITSQMLNSGNSVEFVYNYGVLEKSNSKDQFVAISKFLLQHDVFAAAENKHEGKVHIDDPLGRWSAQINPSSTLFYIGTINYPYIRDAAHILKSLRHQNVEVILCLVNPLTIWPEFKAIDSTIQKPGKIDKLNELLKELQSVGVRVFFVDMGGNLQMSFR